MPSKTVSDRVATVVLEKITGQPATCDVRIQSSEGAITDGRVDLQSALTAAERSQLQSIAAKLIAVALARDGFTS